MKNNQKRKRKLTQAVLGHGQMLGGGGCSNTVEGVGGRPVSDNLEKSISKGEKKMQREKETYCTWQVT